MDAISRRPNRWQMGTMMTMLYPQVRQPFWQRHPLVTAGAVVVTVWLLLAFSEAQVIVAAAGLAWLAVLLRRRRRANALRDAGLRARADYEHRLNLAGDPRGIFGRYPPVQPGWFPDPQNRCQLRYFDGGQWTGYTASAIGQ
jgi:hypothetical protein